MEVEQLRAGGADRAEEVGLLDVHVECVEADADVGRDRLRERERLRAAVDEVGLEAVERLDRHPDTGGAGVVMDLR